MGCDPIVFIGQDLAFPQNKVHAGDLSLWDINKDEMDMVEDIFGEPVGSMISFKHAIYIFEKAFKETQATIIDATEAGAKKHGALVMRLRDVIDEYGQVPAINIKEILRGASRNVEAVRMEGLLCELEQVSGELNVVQKECHEIVRVAKHLQKRIVARQTQDEDFVKLSEKAETLTQAMDERGRLLHLMGEHNFGLELYMARHEVVAIDEIEEGDEKITQQVTRAMVFYPSVAQAAKTFKKPLDRLIQRLHRARELDTQKLDATASAEDWYRRAQGYNKIESRREALQSVHEALLRDPEHVPALKLLARLHLDSNRLDEALATVQVLGDLAKPDRNLNSLAQEAQAKHKAWSERCSRLNAEFSGKLRKESEEEAGWFYYRTKDYPRAVAHLERVISGTPTAEAYARLGHARSQLGDTHGAFEAWEKGIELDPTRADLYKEMGTLALAQSMNEQAEQFFSEAFRLEPDDAKACERLAHLYLERSAYVEAAVCYENLLRLLPSRSDLIPQLAALYQRQIAVAASTH
jgi:tetratricopeptide (TPR) repeat protein